MNERKSHRIRNENLKTQIIHNKTPQIELGKLVRLPYIRKITPQVQHDRRSVQNKESFVMKCSNKDGGNMEVMHLHLMTLQEIQLCKDSLEKEGFPRIGREGGYLPRQRSIESLQMSLRNRDKKSLTKNQIVRDYKLGHVIGKGAYSVVRLATNKKGKRVAFKIYTKSSLSNEDRVHNLQNEIKVISSLQHPSVLTFLEHIQTQSSINIVTELCENRSMWDYLKGECFQTVPEDIAKYMIKQLAKALSYLHSKEIVHRDLKMENVLIDREFKIKLIDFGFSLQLNKDNTMLKDYCGTPNYIAPEVAKREGYYGKPADLWALGVIVFRMVAGSFPYKNVKNELKMPSELTPELKTLLAHMLNLDYLKRPTVDEVLQCEWLSR